MKNDYSSELDNKTLLLKTSNSGVTEQKEIKLILTWKLHPYWLGLMMPEGAMKTTRKENKSLISPTCES